MRRLIFKAMLLFVAATATFYATAQDGDVEIAHLCKEGEEVVFSCMTGQKNISFCATPRYTAEKGHMIYRFGVAGNSPELEYPNRPMPVGKAFRVSSLVIEDTWKGKSTNPNADAMTSREVAANKFQEQHLEGWPNGEYTEVAFTKSSYTYTLFYQIAGGYGPESFDAAGIAVEKFRAKPIYLLCNHFQKSIDRRHGKKRVFASQMNYLNDQFHAKNNFKDEAKNFRGVFPWEVFRKFDHLTK